MISFNARSVPFRRLKADAVLYFVPEEKKEFREAESFLESLSPGLSAAMKAASFSGAGGQSLALFPRKLPFRALILLGMGKRARLTQEEIRRAAARGRREAARLKASSLAVLLRTGPDLSPAETASAVTEGIALSSYRYDTYITEKKNRGTIRNVDLIVEDRRSIETVRAATRRAAIVCAGTSLARDLANAPANELYPETLARHARNLAKQPGCSVRVFDERKIRSLKMGGLLGVAQGSNRPPRFIVIDYRPRVKNAPTIVLVGKGVTFDAGGISIKPAAGMSEMKMDMSGAAAVIGTFHSATRLKIPVRLIGLIPTTENLLGGSAMKPGDILTHYNGKTSEIDNTDAEGRLILADALSYADRFEPDLVIDLATLTGACVVALAHVAAGMMGNDQTQMDRLLASGERTHERVWQLPLFEEYEKLIRSHVADVKNVGGRWGGAITAALFLKKFIGDYSWIHLDIAGPAILEEDVEYTPRGGSGFGVRLLADFLENWKKH